VNGERDDRQRIMLAASGDQQAFAELVQRHQGRIFNLAYRFSRDRQDAEELAQEIFFKVWRHARSFRGDSLFSTWLYRLAVNTCLNHRQGKKARPEPQTLVGDLPAGGAADPAGDDLVAADREARLRAALDSLPPRQRLALALASFEDKTYEEIAAAMDVSVPAVESLLFRARQNLAALLLPLKKKGEL
jgi:RNA polymerase sigma-70 factor (ECF subfamily)